MTWTLADGHDGVVKPSPPGVTSKKSIVYRTSADPSSKTDIYHINR